MMVSAEDFWKPGRSLLGGTACAGVGGGGGGCCCLVLRRGLRGVRGVRGWAGPGRLEAGGSGSLGMVLITGDGCDSHTLG